MTLIFISDVTANLINSYVFNFTVFMHFFKTMTTTRKFQKQT